MMNAETDDKRVVWPFRLKALDDLRELARSLSLEIDAVEDISVLSEPVRVGNRTAPNSLAVHPMEGCDGDADG